MLSKKVFIDDSVLYAFVDRVDPKHEQAAAYFRFFSLEGYQLWTDVESISLCNEKIASDISPSLARDFLKTMTLTDMNIIYPGEPDFKLAIKLLSNYPASELSFPKSLMAVEAEKRGISQIATFVYLPQLFGLQVFYLPM